MDTLTILVILLAAAAGVALFFVWRKRRTATLRRQFGPEYQHTVQQYGDQARAEADLLRRQKRRERLHIHPLPQPDREHFVEAWKANQARFVDDPRGAVLEADEIVSEIMKRRGYPVEDFDSRVDDISVDHPHVAENYRTAFDIVERYKRGHASTEELRKAMLCYRALFEELVELEGAKR
jgi:hypothetical protein